MTRYSSLKSAAKTRDERILESFILPTQNGVKNLYKYRSMVSEKEIKWLGEIFRDREIYLPSAAKLNDPFECRPLLSWYKRGKKLQNYFAQMVLERFPEDNRETRRQRAKDAEKRFRSNQNQFMQNAYEDFLRTTGIYSLSQIRDNILMWSHYSRGHTGIVIEFDTTKELYLFGQAIKVHYSKEYPIVNLMEFGDPEQFKNALITK